ncbi:FAD-dependent oxidoreductase, partial [Enterobacter hormaechei]|uniref:FAD-dependent oxidoreductase n=1 Tax=Enterobacter hormaechei TaxID=158836 RepID=UPI0013D43955
TTDTLFELPDLPRTLAVIGGGPVGIELAQAMARLGIETTLIEGGRSLAGLSEPGLVAEAAEIFGRELTLHLETEVEAAEADCDGLRLRW